MTLAKELQLQKNKYQHKIKNSCKGEETTIHILHIGIQLFVQQIIR
jgi:hypothetical protein